LRFILFSFPNKYYWNRHINLTIMLLKQQLILEIFLFLKAKISFVYLAIFATIKLD